MWAARVEPVPFNHLDIESGTDAIPDRDNENDEKVWIDDRSNSSPPSTPSPQNPQSSNLLNPKSSVFAKLISLAKTPNNIEVFKLKQGCSHLTVCYCIFHTLFSIASFLFSLSKGSDAPVWLSLSIWLRPINIPFIWGYVFFSKKYVHSDELGKDGKRILNLGNMLILLHAAFAASYLLSWAHARNGCSHEACFPDFPDKVIPIRIMMYSIGGGIALPMFYPIHSAWVGILASLVIYSALFAASVLVNMSYFDMFSVLAVALIIFFSTVSYESNVLSIYISSMQFEAAYRVKCDSENKEYHMNKQKEEMRHMLGNVAHDLRTPLQAFQSELELLFDIAQKECGDVSQSMVKSIRQLQRIGNFMNMTINRCIDFTKVTSGIKLKPSIESISFPDTVNWVVGVMAKNCSTTVPIVLVPIPTNIHNQIFTDKLWLMENLLCLVSNAQKFTTEGEITVRCSLRSGMLTSIGRNLNLSSRGTDNLISDSDLRINATNDSAENECGTPMIRIAVEDTGIGIAKESRSRLFQPFIQAQRRTGGVGLGLYSLKKRLDALGGECGIDSRSDGASGVCVWMTIPYKPDDTVREFLVSPTHHAISSVKGIQRHSPRQDSALSVRSMLSGVISQDVEDFPDSRRRCGSLNILLVDDSGLIRKATRRALIKEGHHVEVARDGSDCLRILHATEGSEFDLILMDLQMPVMDGLEATKRIREKELQGSDPRHVTIIGISANPESEARRECLDSGMDGFIEKPLKVSDLHDYYTRLVESEGVGGIDTDHESNKKRNSERMPTIGLHTST